MIEFIKGDLRYKNIGHVVVECGGVGYGLDISLATYEDLPEPGKECELFTLLYVREDAFRLFGFSSTEERDIVEVLIATSGIGPKLSLAILSNMPISDFSRAIAERNIHLLTKIPAIGKKTAERLCVELKGKLKAFQEVDRAGPSGIPGESGGGSPVEDAISALIALGVKPAVAGGAVHKASRDLGDDATVEQLIREGLKYRR